MTITKLGGMLKIADTASPAHTETTLMPVEIAIARIGRAVTMIAVAAGVTTRAASAPAAAAAPAAGLTRLGMQSHVSEYLAVEAFPLDARIANGGARV